jgi:hypothetical protein
MIGERSRATLHPEDRYAGVAGPEFSIERQLSGIGRLRFKDGTLALRWLAAPAAGFIRSAADLSNVRSIA